MKKVLSKDGIREQVFHETDNGFVLETSQPIQHILEANEKHKDFDKQRLGHLNEMHHVARIPVTVIDELNKMGIMRGYAVVDEPAFAKWLNTSEMGNLCKTYRGTI
jgi:hypothetical protein